MKLIDAAAVTVGVLTLTCNEPPQRTPDDVAAVVKDLREHVLTIPAADVAGTAGPNQPFVVLMDVTNGSSTVSVLASLTGDASIYASDGGALLGGVGVQPVRSAAVDATREAERHRDQLAPVSTYEFPPSGYVKFYVRTRAGVYATERRIEVLKDKSDSLYPLYDAVEAVRAQMEKITKVEPGQIYSLSPPHE